MIPLMEPMPSWPTLRLWIAIAGGLFIAAGLFKLARAASLVSPENQPFGMGMALEAAEPGSAAYRHWRIAKALGLGGFALLAICSAKLSSFIVGVTLLSALILLRQARDSPTLVELGLRQWGIVRVLLVFACLASFFSAVVL